MLGAAECGLQEDLAWVRDQDFAGLIFLLGPEGWRRESRELLACAWSRPRGLFLTSDWIISREGDS
jgi:hypothetical protein